MDAVRANRIATELQGRTVGQGWVVSEYLAHGKSAVLVRAARQDVGAAVKIFDPEIVERFGRAMQLERIQRELSLIGASHPNLIRILGGGECASSGHLYVVMDLLAEPNLASVLTSVPRASIWTLVSQIASAAEFLETQGLVHRDIKPDNVAVNADFSRAILLDLGVLRPIGGSHLTDADQRPFLGTLQYSSPEFLQRAEDDTPDGWRALTFYQLGAVAHDLIMQRRLFAEQADPYARLVEAVLHADPRVDANDVDPDLVLLSRSCLLKDPQQRLRLVTWRSFRSPSPRAGSRAAVAIERIRRLQALAEMRSSVAGEAGVVDDQGVERRRALIEGLRMLDRAVREQILGTNNSFRVPPMVMRENLPDDDAWKASIRIELGASRVHGMTIPLTIWIGLTSSDAAGKVLELRMAAAASESSVTDAEMTAHAVQVLEGPLEERVMGERLRENLLPIVLGAMEARSADTPVWFKCVADEP